MEAVLNNQNTSCNQTDLLYEWLALYLTPGLGAAGCKKLVDHFGSPKAVFGADKKHLLAMQGFKKKAIEHLHKGPAYKEAEHEINTAQKSGITITCIESLSYPRSLRAIHNPPVILYVKGDIDALEKKPLLAIVGSRAASSYGLKIACSLAGILSRKNIAIVSGLALGIDAAAHKGVLASEGSTIGVLGCGIDVVYPVQNRSFYRKIPQKGALISEYPLGTKPDSFRFPARNRIISGLSLGVIVVEAGPKSGSLITVKHALEQGKEVFAVPGRIDSLKSEGTHRLIQDGAKLVHHVDDILVEFEHFHFKDKNDTQVDNTPPQELTDEEMLIYAHLDVYPKTIDEIIQQTCFNANTVNELLLHMELKGIVEVLPGKQYKRCFY